MPISFTCESCKKKVKAPDNAGGKWGKCPQCQHRCYIPLPVVEGEEELKLAPIDESEESKYNEMMRETHNLTRKILSETAVPTEGADVRSSNEYDEKQLLKNIIIYLRQMADGELGLAAKNVEKIMQFKEQGRIILKKMGNAERPEPELEDVPPKVLNKFIKELNKKLT